MRRYIEKFQELCKSRIFIMLCSICLLFFILAIRLFSLQIIHGEKYQDKLTTSVLKTVALPASRGAIYDRYGRPLATNHAAYSVKIDDSINLDLKDQKNQLILTAFKKINSHDVLQTEDLPISKAKPYDFLFNDNEKAERAWKEKNGIPKSKHNMTGEETLSYFIKKFDIPSHFSMAEKRCIISLHLDLSDKNLMILSLIQMLEENGEDLVDDLPISKGKPYTLLFDGNKSKERAWKQSVAMADGELLYDGAETMEYLQDFFEIPKILPDELTRKVIGLRYSLYLQRYRKYQPVTAALDVSDKTLAVVEENQDTFPSIIIDTDSLREYPQGQYFSHIIGYIRKISEEQYAELKEYKDEDGNPLYSISDTVGKSGLEELYERQLNGKDGEMLVEVDSVGRRMNTLKSKQPLSGNDVFLTLDSQLQKAAFDSLESTLKDILKRKLSYASAKEAISQKELYASMVKSNSISLEKICASTGGEQYALYQKILAQNPKFTLSTEEDRSFALQILTDAIERGEISGRQIVLVLVEQGKITADTDYLARITSGTISPLSVIIQKLDSGELRPSDTGLDPCTGSVVVSRVDSGEVLALVTYPSYDNNMLVNNFNNSYYNQLLHDTTTPLVNRPLKEKKAPGSTLKMVTALAGLESGAIAPNTYIRDLGVFTKAGIPHAKCWIYGSYGGTHGSINVTTALEVSCNYFFYETAYRMGNAPMGTTENSITTLNEYMAAFGLNDYTGIEIGETPPNMASSAFKERIIKSMNPDATSSQTHWTDGDTIRAAIGQSVNNYAPAHMNKYIATLANGGKRYKMHLLSKIENPDGTMITQVQEKVENVLDLQPNNLEAVYKGMLLVSTGPKGTLRGVFNNFPIKVASKSGTAQENLNKSSHTWYVGFAPYENPQIAVTVMIPFGDVPGAPAAVVAKEIIGEYMGLNYQPKNTYMKNILAD